MQTTLKGKFKATLISGTSSTTAAKTLFSG